MVIFSLSLFWQVIIGLLGLVGNLSCLVYFSLCSRRRVSSLRPSGRLHRPPQPFAHGLPRLPRAFAFASLGTLLLQPGPAVDYPHSAHPSLSVLVPHFLLQFLLLKCMLQLNVSARVVELVDTQDLKSCGR